MIAALAIALATLAPAQDLPDVAHLSRRIWDTRDGLPQNTVLDIAQAKDGSLLLATFGGLAHFDGANFTIQDVANSPELGTNRITHVELSSGGQTLIATSEGALLFQSSHGWNTITFPKGVDSITRDLIWGADEYAWIATASGLFRWSSGEASTELIFKGNFRSVAIASDGSLLAGASRGLVRFANGEETLLDGAACETVCAGPKSDFFTATGSSTRRYENGQWYDLPISAGHVKDLFLDKEKRLWVAGTDALGYWDVAGSTWHPISITDETEFNPYPRSIFQDREGNIWVGTDSRGLLLLSPTPLQAIATPGQSESIISVASSPGGEIWAVGKSLWRISSHITKANLPFTPDVVAAATKGGLWISTWEGVGTLRGGQVEILIHDLPGQVGAMLEARDGSLLIARAGSLFVWRDGELTETDLKPFGIDPNVSSLFEDSTGRVWIGSISSLCIWDDSTARVLHSGTDLPLGEVRAFYENEPGEMWVGTYGGGIYRVSDDSVDVLNQERGLHENIASALVPDGFGNLVVMGNRTFTMYRLSDLESAIDDPKFHLNGRIFNSGPGIGVLEGNGVRQPRFAVDQEGRIWFPTLEGLVNFDPRLVSRAEVNLRPRVRMDSPDANITADMARGLASFTITGNQRSLVFEFSCPTYTQPRQVLYRYRLVGRDPEWLISDVEMVVHYGDLAPGDYEFWVEAAIAGGAFGQRNDVYAITVKATLWESPWLKRALALSMAGLLFGFSRVRLRAIRNQSESLERTVRSRTEELTLQVAERERAEEGLRQAGDELEAKVKLRTSELAQALLDLELDVEKREKLEARLRESERMEAVGKLAGGVAHDFNNILTAVLGEADLALESLSASGSTNANNLDLKQSLGNVRDAGLRAAQLTRQLLAYSRQQVMQPKVVDPREIIAALHAMLLRLVPDNVELVFVPGAVCAPILIDPGHLEQVIVNLVVNASEAMPEGGRIQVSCGRVQGDEDGRVEIVVEDTGAGFSARDRAHIFEPFFSTKGQSRGLGLASVHGIILQSGGSIDVESEVGHGSTFRIRFPVTTQAPSDSVKPKAESTTSGISALLIDDDDDVRRIAKLMLEHGGVTVFEAALPDEAIELARTYKDKLDILVTDVVMPHKNGRELSEDVRSICPDIKVLFISGHVAEELTEKDLLSAGANLLSKPFTAQILIARVNELLETARD